MANNAPTIRRTISRLDSPLELRELNRQLEWLFKKLLGNLDEKSFSDGAVKHITTTVENHIVDTVESESVETNLLNAAIAKLMVAVIGVCDADYLSAIDVSASNLLVRDGYADGFSFRNLKVLYAQFASATIRDLCIKATDGNYYLLDVDSSGNVSAVKTEVNDSEIAEGVTNAGNVILESEITAEQMNTSSFLATYALINKIRADEIDVVHLFAREAFISELTTSQIFANGGSLQILAQDVSQLDSRMNDASIAIGDVSGDVSALDTELTQVGNNLRDAIQDVVDISSRFEQTAEAFELELSKKIGGDELRQYLRYEDGTVELGSNNSRYKLQANNEGVVIFQDDNVMTRMVQNTVAAPVFEAGRMLKIGEHTIKTSASGALIFN